MILLRTASLLIISNIFMTFAWYGHLRNLSDKKWYVAVVISWGIALFEYMFMIPANRIGATELSLPQLKILQDAIRLGASAAYGASDRRFQSCTTWPYTDAKQLNR